MSRPRVVAIASHPIQYHAPWFRGLAEAPGIDFLAAFVQVPDAKAQGHGFGIEFTWDVPLLSGYAWQRVDGLRGRGGLDGFFAARIADPVAALRQLDAQVLVLTGWHAWPLVQLLHAARRLRIPVIMRGEANALRARGAASRAWHRWLLSQCAACLPIGRSSREFYRGYGMPEQCLFDAPYFVDNERLASSAPQSCAARQGLRARWNIASDAMCFGFVGKLQPKKRVLDLLRAARTALDSGVRLHVLVVGTGEQEEAARTFAADHRLPVTFAGFLNQSEIGEAYAAMDAVVLPSDFGETWGLVVNEAMACGRPAIVSDRVGCGPDLVTPGATGAVFPFGDTSALARLLVQWCGDPAAVQRMGESARQHVFAHYRPRDAVEGTLRAVDWVMARQ